MWCLYFLHVLPRCRRARALAVGHSSSRRHFLLPPHAHPQQSGSSLNQIHSQVLRCWLAFEYNSVTVVFDACCLGPRAKQRNM
jgi:hypothetical protein|eukprot:SAG25_NODE_166_length_13075_cov_19.523736_7_plen_83_part_00